MSLKVHLLVLLHGDGLAKSCPLQNVTEAETTC